MQFLNSIDEIAARYDAVLCDVWGVVHNGRRPYPHAAAALARLRAAGKSVVLLTNVPKPRGPIPGQLDRMGFPREAWDVIVTSGDAIRAELAARAPGPMHKVGPPDDAPLWEGLEIEWAPLERARYLAVSGLNTYEDAPDQYVDMLAAARARDMEMLCANPDIIVRVGDKLIWCAGALARDYVALGGGVVMAGKPHAPIYDLAYKEVTVLRGGVDKARVLCIGDGVATDVAGANAQGLDVLFVASGMHGEGLSTEGRVDPVKVEAALAADGVRANYVMRELA